MSWWVYVLRSERIRRTYVGVTTDPERRLAEHNGEKPGGAKSTRAGRPWGVAALYGPYKNQSEAQTAEHDVRSHPADERLGRAT
ncbi:MAG: GIY-YIG nuclease family protein [Gemmatimonadetes bacterium]|nr:GIY-YIG nuclease family protein [Gemmatimonadota bacterium]